MPHTLCVFISSSKSSLNYMEASHGAHALLSFTNFPLPYRSRQVHHLVWKILPRVLRRWSRVLERGETSLWAATSRRELILSGVEVLNFTAMSQLASLRLPPSPYWIGVRTLSNINHHSNIGTDLAFFNLQCFKYRPMR